MAGLPADQFRRACIELKPYSQPTSSMIIATFQGVHHLLNQGEIPAINAQRYIPQPTKDFWTVHLVGSFYRYDSWGPQWGIGGWAPSGLSSTAIVFTTTAEYQVNDCPGLTNLEKQELAYLYKQWLIAHEIGHVMNCKHSATGIMCANISPDSLIKDKNFLKFADESILAMQASEMPQ